MNNIVRARIFNQAIVETSAQNVWAYLIDWAGERRERRPSGAMGDLAFSKISLEGGTARIPRTRVMDFGAFGVIRETLLYQDDVAMHLYYNIEGTGPHGIRNYLATTDVDSIRADRSQVTITARFDLDGDQDLLKAKSVIDLAHNQAVIGGLRAFFAMERREII